MMKTKQQAQEWARDMCENGTGEARAQYLEKFGAGTAAKRIWDDAVFTLGIEYGILITVAFIYGDLEKGK